MAFAELSNQEQVACLARLGSRALAAWDLPEARLDLIKYRENAVFRVTAADARYVLRVHRPDYRSDAEIRAEVAWMRALAESGISTPAVLPTREGDVLTVARAEGVPEPRQCDLLAWVEGEPLGTLEHGVALDDEALRRTYRTVGEIAARLHAHAENWKRPEGFVRPSWEAETLVGDTPTFGAFWELEELTDAQRRVLFQARDRTRERLRALGPPPALIHGDLIPDNLLTDGDQVRVIDFDDCGWSWLGFELATSLFALRAAPGFESAWAGWLEGYRAVQPFPEAELALMPTFFMARGLSYLGWPAGRREIEPMQKVVPFLARAITELAEEYLAETS